MVDLIVPMVRLLSCMNGFQSIIFPMSAKALTDPGELPTLGFLEQPRGISTR